MRILKISVLRSEKSSFRLQDQIYDKAVKKCDFKPKTEVIFLLLNLLIVFWSCGPKLISYELGTLPPTIPGEKRKTRFD